MSAASAKSTPCSSRFSRHFCSSHSKPIPLPYTNVYTVSSALTIRPEGASAITGHQEASHSIAFSGGACPRSAKSSGGEDLEIEEPISCGDSAAYYFHPTLPGMLGSTLIRYQVVEVR